ncbi:DUF6206 family protein [Leucobacter albus]|uniref:DUF6206 family protein n=1 Tax=Leucobacter albus TaxID=272210 RepID=A0ABW3TPL8_9MICO
MIQNTEALVTSAHRSIERAMLSGTLDGLRILGFGEITVAVAWPAEAPAIVVKRLPPFPSASAVSEYRAVLDAWSAELEHRGVALVPTALHTRVSDTWGTVGYIVQPVVNADDLLHTRCRDAGEAERQRLLEQVVAALATAVTADIAVDAQLPNWVVRDDGTIALLDVSTPLIRDSFGRDRLPAWLFVQGYPAALRAPLSRWAVPKIIAEYHDPQTALLDVAANMRRVGLGAYIDDLLLAANASLRTSVTPAMVRHHFRGNTRMWALMQRLRLWEQGWQRRWRKRPYPMLLPPAYRTRSNYGTADGEPAATASGGRPVG